MAKFVKLKLLNFLVFSQFFVQDKQINFFYIWNIDDRIRHALFFSR